MFRETILYGFGVIGLSIIFHGVVFFYPENIPLTMNSIALGGLWGVVGAIYSRLDIDKQDAR